METKIVRRDSKTVKERRTAKGKNLAELLERSRRFGLYLLVLDYLFIFFIMFRVESINHILRFELEGFRIRRMYFEYYYAYVIPVLNVPGFLVSYLFIISSSSFLQKKYWCGEMPGCWPLEMYYGHCLYSYCPSCSSER